MFFHSLNYCMIQKMDGVKIFVQEAKVVVGFDAIKVIQRRWTALMSKVRKLYYHFNLETERRMTEIKTKQKRTATIKKYGKKPTLSWKSMIACIHQTIMKQKKIINGRSFIFWSKLQNNSCIIKFMVCGVIICKYIVWILFGLQCLSICNIFIFMRMTVVITVSQQCNI